MKKNLLFLSLLAILALNVSCSKKTDVAKDPLAAHIDTTIKAGDDFFLYANNKWFKENPIPASEQSNGLWTMIQDTINAQIKTICVSSAELKNEPKGTAKQKIGDFYYSGMDSVSLNKKGIEDIKTDLDMIDAIADINGLIKATAYIQQVSGSPLFRFAVGQDDKNSAKNVIFLSQGGLSLPERSYYVDMDERAVNNREKFVIHLANMFKIMGYDEAKAKASAENMMKLETAIAKSSRKLEDTRDPLTNYTKLSYKDLAASTPNLNWDVFFSNIGLNNVDSVVVGQPEFLKALNGSLKSTPIADWKDYLKYHLIRGLASFVDDRTYQEVFSFYSTTLRGVKEQKPRWKRVVSQTDDALGELIGQVYVAEYLPKGAKEKLMEICNSIKAVYAERIKALDWMSEPTKEKALHKLNTVVMKVGYPDKWKDLSSMQIDRSSYVQNIKNANKWGFNYMISKFGKPVDRTEWNMYPQTYNAYYNPGNNEIVIPGSNIIVPGFERKLADDAILYSVIGGSTIGHEITHGFDDQGCKYDENGNLNSWWTEEDTQKFAAKTKMIIDQFNDYVAVDDLHINGSFTQGENIADLGGIVMGYEAFKKTNQFKNKEVIAGLTPERRFFLGYAYAWMINERPEATAAQVRSNVHSPAKFRVLGPLSNMPEFYQAFGVKEGDKMWRPENKRVKIW